MGWRSPRLGILISTELLIGLPIKMGSASWRSVFGLRSRFLNYSDLGGVPDPQLDPQLKVQFSQCRSSRRACPLAPTPHVLSFPVPQDHGRTSRHPRGAPGAVPVIPLCPYRQTQFAESSGGNRILSIKHIGSFSPEPFGWLAPASLLGAREPTLSHGINYTSEHGELIDFR